MEPSSRVVPNGQQKILAADGRRRLLQNVVELLHGIDYPQIVLSRNRNLSNLCSGAPGHSRQAPFSSLNVYSSVSTPI
jgi:hypothetical protein